MRKSRIAIFILLLVPVYGFSLIGSGIEVGGGVPPEVSTGYVSVEGDETRITFTKSVTYNSGTFDLDCTTAGADITMTYSSGSDSNELVFANGATVGFDDSCNVDFGGAANGVEDSEGEDLASFTDEVMETYQTIFASSDADGNGTVGMANTPRAYAYQATGADVVYAIRFNMARDGTAAGNCYAALYQSATAGNDDVPDDQLALSDVVAASDLTDNADPTGVFAYFVFTSPYTLTNTEWYQITHWYTGTDTVKARYATFGGNGEFTRTGSPPAASNDASNWTESDTNGDGAIVILTRG